jgi:hypothetical protein
MVIEKNLAKIDYFRQNSYPIRFASVFLFGFSSFFYFVASLLQNHANTLYICQILPQCESRID